MKKFYHILLIFLFLLFFSNAQAQINIKEYQGALYINNATVKELEDVYKKNHYQRFNYLKDDKYPSIFVNELPSDFQEIKSLKYRNELFIRILAPLALKINEELLNERNTLLRIEKNYKTNKSLSEYEANKLEFFALKYDFFTRHKNDKRIREQIRNLKLRIDIIPPSIFIAAAAIDTDWGASRIANQANSLYKEKEWYTQEGLEPLENKNDGYRFKIFNSLMDSMKSFAVTFNSNINYQKSWQSRLTMVERHGVILGESIAYAIANTPNLPNYVGILDYTTAFYDLYSIDIGSIKKGLKKNEH